ncbi:MAG: universal stress protein [Sphingomonadaceae bacterium]|nr:universal stress protein [Sphingomonadaceae bacterium]
MKSVLLHIQDDAGFEARLQTSLDIVRASKGHLTCLYVTPINAYVAFDNFGGVFVMNDVLKQLEENKALLQARVEQRLKVEDISWDYADSTADPAQALVSRSMLSDLIIMSHPVGDKPQGIAHALVGDVVMGASTPVLLVPDTAKAFDATGAAVVAWNGSFEAGHALRAALPLLASAGNVHIVSVSEGRDHAFPSLAASEYLARHGIVSELHERRGDSGEVGTLLIETAKQLKAQYLVMGAYGHSRAREYLFGGVTRNLLNDSPFPLLLAR